jgi:predicted nucleic acid-binding protein
MLLRTKQKGVIAEVKTLLTALAQVDFRIAKP